MTIPEEAVEAAARHYYTSRDRTFMVNHHRRLGKSNPEALVPDWDGLDDGERDDYRNAIRGTVLAAAPHMYAHALREAAEEVPDEPSYHTLLDLADEMGSN